MTDPEYLQKLRLWFEFMKLSLDPIDPDVLSRIKPWNKQVWAHISPVAGETFRSWLGRCKDELQMGREFPVVVHRTVGHMDSVPGLAEMHVTIDLTYTRTEILREIERLLVRRRVPSGRGRKAGVRKRADFQPNAVFVAAALEKTLKVWQKHEEGIRRGKLLTNLRIGTSVLGLKVVETKHGTNTASIEAAVSRHKRRAREIIIAVRQGRFPDPLRPPNALES